MNANRLKNIDLFQVFSEDQLQELATLGAIQSYPAHTNILIEGEMSWGLYLILEGRVKVFKTGYDLGSLHAGNFFGEMSLIDPYPRFATVQTEVFSEFFLLTKEVFETFLLKSETLKLSFYESCLKILVLRLRELDSQYVTSQYQLWKKALQKQGGKSP